MTGNTIFRSGAGRGLAEAFHARGNKVVAMVTEFNERAPAFYQG